LAWDTRFGETVPDLMARFGKKSVLGHPGVGFDGDIEMMIALGVIIDTSENYSSDKVAGS
jgi:hypothetical protein